MPGGSGFTVGVDGWANLTGEGNSGTHGGSEEAGAEGVDVGIVDGDPLAPGGGRGATPVNDPAGRAEAADGPVVPIRWRLAQTLLGIPAQLQQDVCPYLLMQDAARRVAATIEADVEVRWAGHSAPQASAESGTRELVLPVEHQDVPFAYLVVSRPEGFEVPLMEALAHVARDLSATVDAVATRRLRTTLKELRAVMHADPDLPSATRSAVRLAVELTAAQAGVLLLQRSTGFEPLATLGEWNDDPSRAAKLKRIAEGAIEADGPELHAGQLISVPIGSSKPARCILVLRFPDERPLASVSTPILAELASVAAPFVDARWRDSLLTHLLDLNRASEDTPTSEIYGQVLRTALLLVPGADCGTLLTRTRAGAPFEYKAAEGFDLQALARQEVTEEATMAWYGPDEAGWRAGMPRVLTNEAGAIERLGGASTPDVAPSVTRYSTIKSTLCLPVLRDGEVMAVVNLDHVHDGGGLARDSAQLAQRFGPPVASLLYRQLMRDLLRKAALTDELTGLPNRRAFDKALQHELDRAERGGVGPSVLVMDLKRFKAINDRFGHSVGDEALVAVANALRSVMRTVDLAARMGGDEFVALLTDTSHANALAVKARVQRKVAGIDVGLGPTEINVGVASYEEGTTDADALLRAADVRMYEEKSGGGASGRADVR